MLINYCSDCPPAPDTESSLVLEIIYIPEFSSMMGGTLPINSDVLTVTE